MSQVLPPPPPTGTGIYVPNNLVWAILSTLFCCLPLGVVSIVYASQVDGKRAAGDVAGARDASRKAGLWAMWSALAAPILIALWFLMFGGLAILGSVLEH
ncbi:CD225/dispanin family protein [Xanthomonas translucens]|nr:CD225/dispanin family protein [Xanthomonas translucens]UKE50570.1 CD225/dispanin family protein [Xanthomonas translucens]